MGSIERSSKTRPSGWSPAGGVVLPAAFGRDVLRSRARSRGLVVSVPPVWPGASPITGAAGGKGGRRPSRSDAVGALAACCPCDSPERAIPEGQTPPARQTARAPARGRRALCAVAPTRPRSFTSMYTSRPMHSVARHLSDGWPQTDHVPEHPLPEGGFLLMLPHPEV